MENILNISDYLVLGVKEVDEHMIQIHWVVRAETQIRDQCVQSRRKDPQHMFKMHE